MPQIEPRLNEKDKALVRLFMASCFHRWDLLEDLGKACYKVGCSVAEVRGCVRHLIVVAGYGPCLAATLHLFKAKLLPEDTPGKVGGPPGDAFEVVYEKVTDKVRRNMHAADPVLAEYIRLHLYGDIYSSPGVSMRQKQLLMAAFLAQANMHDQLFGHLIAAFRFGVQEAEALKAVDMAFELAPAPSSDVYKGAMKTLTLAIRKHQRSVSKGEGPIEPEVHIDPTSVRLPPLPPLFNGPEDGTSVRRDSGSSDGREM